MTPRHCSACNQMSLGDWRRVRDAHVCPICRVVTPLDEYELTSARAASVLSTSRPELVDTANRFAVATGSRGVVILLPPTRPMSEADALNLAAWLVLLTGADLNRFRDLLQKCAAS